ncbi:hypothetical protein PF008_g10935 [Phytophthora fragariae]|uniref:ZSWIM3 N-terminal domain-containing protein n=1 Tax=Phytophthora fragariae TaxID=53985 RepID=A0A6G0RSU4_9STRA|nr:hypothetical protein PF008_g10935 [Phytophthora fragariae]
MDAGSEDVEEGDDGEDGEDMVEEGDADAENANAAADDDAVENMVGGGNDNTRPVTAFENSIRQFVRTARDEAEAEAQKRRVGSAATGSSSTSVVSQTKRGRSLNITPTPGRSDKEVRPSPKRAKIGREGTIGITTNDTVSTATRHRERRRTNTWKDRQQITNTHTSVQNVKPGLPKKTFANWEDFKKELERYHDEHKVFFRVRNSQSLEKHNTLPGAVRLPNHFTHSFQTLWCTHGATKASRGEGLRQGGQHYTGCEAGFKVRSAKVVKKGVAKWVVCIDQETEISTHNHKTTKTIFESYKGAKSMPLTAKVRQDLGLMTEIKTSTAAISRYLLDKLGGCRW